MSDTHWLRKEFDEDRDAVVRTLTGMIYSYDQNGHLMLVKGDILALVAAVDLLKRAQAMVGLHV